MSQPPVTMTVEPLVGGNIVYLPMASSTPGGTPRGRLLVELTLTNSSGKSLTATSMMTSFPGASAISGPVNRSMNQVIDPFETVIWSYTSAADQNTFNLAAAPSTITVTVTFNGYSEPLVATLPVAAHTSALPGGGYRFPSSTTDLGLGEFWQLNGCNHPTGNHESFGYDMSIWGPDYRTGEYSPLQSGGDPATVKASNEEYRIFGKPVRAMADGEVLSVVDFVPNNPTPLYATTDEDLADLLKVQQDTYWNGLDHGEAGNHVYIRHGNEIVLYAHLQQGSIDPTLTGPTPATPGVPATPGTAVVGGQILGKAGNSGNSTNPHLHIHATAAPFGAGGPRPLLFTAAWTIDNDTLVGKPGQPLVGDPGGRWVRLTGGGIPEGSAKPGEHLVGDSFLHPADTPPVWPEVVRLHVEENDMQALLDSMWGKGMKPTWINGYTIDMGPFYYYTFFNVIFRPALGSDEPVVFGQDRDQYQQTYNSLVGQGYRLKQVESYFSFRQDRQLFAAIFHRPGGLKPRKDPRAYHAQPYTQHRAFLDAWTAEGFVPSNISVVSVKGQLSYTGLYDFVGSALSGVHVDEAMTAQILQTTFDDRYHAGSYLAYLKGYSHLGAARYTGVWYSGGSKGKVRSAIRESGFRSVLADQQRGKKLIRSVSGYQLDGDAAFTGLWNA